MNFRNIGSEGEKLRGRGAARENDLKTGGAGAQESERFILRDHAEGDCPDQLIQDQQIVAALHGGVGSQTEETGPETGGFTLFLVVHLKGEFDGFRAGEHVKAVDAGKGGKLGGG